MGLAKKDEDSSPYLTADRSSALQESKQFHETPLRARKCSETCCKEPKYFDLKIPIFSSFDLN